MQKIYTTPSLHPHHASYISHTVYQPRDPLPILFISLVRTFAGLIIRQILLIATPAPKEADAVLDGVDGVADEGEDDEEADDYDCDDDVAFDHFCGGFVGGGGGSVQGSCEGEGWVLGVVGRWREGERWGVEGLVGGVCGWRGVCWMGRMR